MNAQHNKFKSEKVQDLVVSKKKKKIAAMEKGGRAVKGFKDINFNKNVNYCVFAIGAGTSNLNTIQKLDTFH